MGLSEQELAEIEKTTRMCGIHGSAVINAKLNVSKLVSEIRRLRSELEFYADEMTYVEQMAPGSPTGFTAEIDADKGQRAREALK